MERSPLIGPGAIGFIGGSESVPLFAPSNKHDGYTYGLTHRTKDVRAQGDADFEGTSLIRRGTITRELLR